MASATFADRKGYVWVPAPSGHPKATLKAKRLRAKTTAWPEWATQ